MSEHKESLVKVLEYIVNDEQDKAADLLHNVFVEKAKNHWASLQENDEIVEDKGVKVFIDSSAIMYLLGTEMDYKKEEFSSNFVFKNPNETERCGCGESFKI